MKLIRQLFGAAREQGKQVTAWPDGQWKVHPIYTTTLQNNGFDCGVWVLGVIAAVLRGHHMPGISQDDIPRFRKLLHGLIQISSTNCSHLDGQYVERVT